MRMNPQKIAQNTTNDQAAAVLQFMAGLTIFLSNLLLYSALQYQKQTCKAGKPYSEVLGCGDTLTDSIAPALLFLNLVVVGCFMGTSPLLTPVVNAVHEVWKKLPGQLRQNSSSQKDGLDTDPHGVTWKV